MLPSILSKSRNAPSPAGHRRHLRRLLSSSLGRATTFPPTTAIALSPPPPSTNSHLASSPHSYHRYASILQSCVAAGSLRAGRKLHGRLLVSGLGPDTVLSTKLVDLYAACGHVGQARRLFDGMPKRNVFLWNVLIRAYAREGPREAAVQLYRGMAEHGVEPDNFTYPLVLKACAALLDLETGREVHEHVSGTRWGQDVFVCAGVVDMYAKCGCVDDARAVFDGIAVRDAVVWNSMIAAYGQNGRPMEALSLCRDMASNGVGPTIATLVSTISAAADAAALPRGRELHGFGWRRGFGGQDKLKTSLVDMYAKSGWLHVARVLFEQLMKRELVSWNAMICGYGMHGHADEALELFNKMRGDAQVTPDNITFVGVLSACNHRGMVEEAKEFFGLMVDVSSIEPTVQHYTCLVDVLGHTGRFEEAYDLIKGMSIKPDSGIWGALLNGCKIHKNVELGELALQKLIELEPEDAGNYVHLSNIYAQSGKWENAARVRKLMTNRGLKKILACSWIELKGKTHGFLVGDASHPRSDEIYEELERLEGLMSDAGYVPDTMPVFHNVGDDEKRNMVRSHSERLAIAFGLISTPPGTKLLVTKNLRVCEDCHVVIKLISKISQREIIIRDVNRYHHFVNGECSCKDYW
ncbi:pentatricopeptide repeat-containing protein CRR2, chloroplastic-like [Aegilops tauschii subsp. strangulata]|uniref:DYW domain-containing protein n=3 Tax=Aegilops tauschii TaxID=37682 RepID=A0A453S628_AEGTS|nr:pentatricopeptide repeat-containing protein At2g01510, mitochondrial-like [Aegilops tauschii subsp. strangulata]